MAQKMGIKNSTFDLLWPRRRESKLALLLSHGPEEGDELYHVHSLVAWKSVVKIVLSLSYGPRREIKITFHSFMKSGV